MVKIGKIKFFGKHYNGSSIDYGQIITSENQKIYFKQKDVLCNVSYLLPGAIVQFNISDKNAVDLKLLRVPGFIEWINRDANTINYGLAKATTPFKISNEENLEVFFHHSQVNCKHEILTKGKAVTFGLRYNNKKNSYEAINLTILNEKEELEVIELCIHSDNEKLWKPIFYNYLSTINDIDRQIELCLNKLKIHKDPYFTFADSIPKNILIKSQEIRKFISSKKSVEILVYLIEQSSNSNTFEKVYFIELQELLIKLANYTSERRLILAKIPNNIKKNKYIYSCLSKEEQALIIIELIQDTKNNNINDLLEELQNSLELIDKHSIVWVNIPKNILSNEDIWNKIPLEIRLDLLLKSPEKILQDSLTVNRMVDTLIQFSESEIRSKINKIPDEVKQHSKIISILPPQEQLNILISKFIHNKTQIENIIPKISFKERQLLEIPDWIKQISSINSCWYKILNAKSRVDSLDAEQIREFVKQRNITNLCHFTTIDNLSGICREGGILSIRQLQNRKLCHHQIDEGRWDRKPNHICCSINSYNYKYMYHAKQKADFWVLLFIKPDYLWKKNTLFCPINAATDCGAHIKQGFTGLQSMYADEVVDRSGRHTRQYLSDNYDYLPTCDQAEVMVHESISIEDISEIQINEIEHEERVRNAGWQGNIYVNQKLFR